MASGTQISGTEYFEILANPCNNVEMRLILLRRHWYLLICAKSTPSLFVSHMLNNGLYPMIYHILEEGKFSDWCFFSPQSAPTTSLIMTANLLP